MPRGARKKLNFKALEQSVADTLSKQKYQNKDKLFLEEIVEEVALLYYNRNKSSYIRARHTRVYDIETEIRNLVAKLVVSHGWEKKRKNISDNEMIDGKMYSVWRKKTYFIKRENNGINK